MDILPKNYNEFLSKKYWDSFFKKLEQKNNDSEFFEWYGEFPCFAPYLITLLDPSHQILNIGCGNSLFSEQLYDQGYSNIKNIDFSEKVIKKMRKRSSKRPEMSYEVGDVFAMKYEGNSFDTVIDKGTLDAVFPEDSEVNLNRVRGLFQKILEILKKNGNYLIISLLQEHILAAILDTFQGLDIVIHEVLIENSKMFPFLVHVRKSPNQNENKIILDLRGKKTHLVEKKECIKLIKEVQMKNNFSKNIKKLAPGQRFTLDIWDSKNSSSEIPKYTFIVVDSENKALLNQRTCACFITPQGRENGYLFSKENGNFELLQQTQMSRLIIVLLNPGHVFSNLKNIQNELNPIIEKAMIPEKCSNMPCPYLTDGDELGERLVLKQTKDFVIEEYKADDDNFYRRLILTKNLNQIQSQFQITYVPEKAFTKKISDKSLLPEKKGFEAGIDQGYLDFDCHKLMVVGLSLMEPQILLEKCNVLVLGGGLCALSCFLSQHFGNLHIETVEISEEIIKIAEEMFEVKQIPEDFLIYCDDAFDFVNKKTKTLKAGTKEEKKIEENDETKEPVNKIHNEKNDSTEEGSYELIIIDINSENENETSPPEKFLSPDFLQNLQRILRKNGMLFINFIAKDEKNFQKALNNIAEVFHIVYSAKVEKDYNTVIYAKNIKYEIHKIDKEEKIVRLEENTIMDKKAIESNFKNMVKNLKKAWSQTLNLESLLNNLVLQFPNLNKNPFEKKNAQVLDLKENLTNNTKEMYIKDLEKVNKNKKKKKKNKMR